MARLLRIERAITWIARSLTANRDANPTPEGVINQILPTVDIFGMQRLAELQFEEVLGALGGIEITHGPVPVGFVRQYLSMEYRSDDLTALRRLQAGRVVAVSTGFPFAGMRDEHPAPGGDKFGFRNFSVPPGGFAAVRANAMAAGARMVIRVLWMEFPVGEYLRTIQ